MPDSHDEVLARLIAYLDENLEEKPSAPIAPSSTLQGDLRLDSIQSFEMVADLEDHYDVSISLDEFQSVQTVGDVARLVSEVIAR